MFEPSRRRSEQKGLWSCGAGKQTGRVADEMFAPIGRDEILCDEVVGEGAHPPGMTKALWS